MSSRLLPLLTPEPQSGERLAAALGVGRVSINTLAHALQQEGYPVVVSRRGYALEIGTPAPWLLRSGPLRLGSRPYRYLGSTANTQDDLRAWAADPYSTAVAGAVVLAERQTAGRGRRGRSWISGPETRAVPAIPVATIHSPQRGHNLTFSLLLPPQPELGRLSLLPLAAGVALAQVTQEHAGVGGLKWPNDLLAQDGRKLAGILLEADLRGEEVTRAVLGIGLNVGSCPEGAACLHEFAPELHRGTLLLALLEALDFWLEAPSEQILAAWRGHSLMLGQRVKVQTQTGTVAGLAHDIGPDGALIIQNDAGQMVRVTAGDVQLIGQLVGQL